MENDYETENQKTGKILKRLDPLSHTYILSFLDQNTLQLIYRTNRNFHSGKFILKLTGVLYLIKRYINRIDRSYFFLFYEQPQFINIQKQQFNKLAIQNIQHFTNIPDKFDSLLQALSNELSSCGAYKEIIKNIQKIVFESDIPMPKIRKETVGMCCQTSFQLFLTEIKFPFFLQQDLEQWQQELHNYLDSKQYQYLIIFCNGKSEVKDKIMTVRYFGHVIGINNWKDYLLKNCELHNIMVIVLGIIDNLIHTYYCIISNHKDPLMKFVQFSLRYSIFRNMIIAVEENLRVTITKYNDVFSASFNGLRVHPKYSIWIAAMRKWNQKMSHFHQQMQLVYQYIVTNQRTKNLLEFIDHESQRLPQIYNPIRNTLNQRDFIISFKEQLYQNGAVSIEKFFENNQQAYDVVAHDYLEYLIDTSVNEFSVHWCGSSNQSFPLSSPYWQFHHRFLHYNHKYLQYLTQIIMKKCPIKIARTILKQVVEKDLQYLNKKFVKPVTSKYLVQQINNSLRQTKNVLQQISQQIITFKLDFDYQDNLLIYFNKKYDISQTCTFSQFLYNPSSRMCFQDLIKMVQSKEQLNSQSQSNIDQQYNSDQENNAKQKIISKINLDAENLHHL